MRRTHNNKGSVLLMVVGLLAILGMLGSTFLLISRLENKQAKARTSRGQESEIAKGKLNEIVTLLQEDLHFGDAGRAYSNLDTTGFEYTDCRDAADATQDPWLASFDRVAAPSGGNSITIPQVGYVLGHPMLAFVTNLTGPTNAAKYRDIPYPINSSFYNIDSDGDTSSPKDAYGSRDSSDSYIEWVFVDTDGDGDPDSVLTNTGILCESAAGADREVDRYYWMATRITDMSGKICINTAGKKDEPLVSGTPASIHMASLTDIDDAKYALIHTSRSDGESLLDYYNNCGSQLVSPAGGEKPFSIGEESYFGWLENGSGDIPRLDENASAWGLTVNNRRNLTTYSSTQSVCRGSEVAATNSSPNPKIFGNRMLATEMVSTPEGRQELLHRLLPLTGENIDMTLNAKLILSATTIGTWNGAGSYAWAAPAKPGDPETKAEWVFTSAASPSDFEHVGTPYHLVEVMAVNRTGGEDLDFATNASFKVTRILDVGGASTTKELGTFHIDQTAGVAGEVSLGCFAVDPDNDALVVKLTNEANGKVAAGIVRLRVLQYDTRLNTEKAAHFVANLWAATTSDAELADGSANGMLKDPFEFKPDGVTTWSVYGVRRDHPRLSEAYVKYIPSVTLDEPAPADPVVTGSDDYKWGVAIEIVNPTQRNIEINGYELYDPVTTTAISLAGMVTANILPAGGRLVVYNYGTGTSGTDDPVTDFNFPVASVKGSPTSWGRADTVGSELNFFRAAPKYLLVRNYGGSPVVRVPVDCLDVASDFGSGYRAVTVEANLDTLADAVAQEVRTRRDSDISVGGRAKFLVAKWVDTVGAHSFGPKAAGLVVVPDTACLEGFDIPNLQTGVIKITDLWRVFFTGPVPIGTDATNGDDLPSRLKNSYATKESRGKATPDLVDCPAPDSLSGYPSVSWPLLLHEVIEFNETDTTREDTSRVYGRININTATKKALLALPWPASITKPEAAGADIVLDDATLGSLADEIIAKRPYAIHGDLGRKIEAWLILQDGSWAMKPDLEAKEAQFIAGIANAITVKSDVFGVNMRLQVGPSVNAKKAWYYFAVIDRSNCQAKSDKPAVLVFQQVK